MTRSLLVPTECPHDFPDVDALGGKLLRVSGPPAYPRWCGEYSVPQKEKRVDDASPVRDDGTIDVDAVSENRELNDDEWERVEQRRRARRTRQLEAISPDALVPWGVYVGKMMRDTPEFGHEGLAHLRTYYSAKKRASSARSQYLVACIDAAISWQAANNAAKTDEFPDALRDEPDNLPF